jgi:hypothetical protein
MFELTLEEARDRYVADLQRVHPSFEEQLADVLLLLDSLLGRGRPPDGPLADVRADYIVRLQQRCRTLDEQVLDLAKACTHLFGPVLGLKTPARVQSF